MTEYHGNDEHQPELDYKQKKGRACHVFTYFLNVYARDRHTGPTTRRRSRNDGVVEYSTFVDSGTLNFTIDAYDADNPQAACKVGEGTMSMSATGNTTNTGMLTVDRLSTATFCCSMPSGC